MTAPGRVRKRRSELRQKQKRRAKISKLRKAYQAAKVEAQRAQILAKLFKIAPNYSVDEFQAPAR